MNIYFSCSITGGRQDQAVYAAIVDHLLAQGHEVPTAHLSSEQILAEETVIEPREVYDRDLNWVEECDALIAEVSTPSHGVGYEIALALFLGKPVFCCYRNGRRVSKMILGNNHPKLRIYEYEEVGDLIAAMEGFITANPL
jgi:nucleoside 2-deoxyribosyltransferase